MNSFSKVTITILIYFLCQFTIGLPISQQPTKVLIQLNDEVTVVLTNHNGVNKDSSDVYITTVGHPNVEISKKIQSTEVKFPEIQFPEVKFPAPDA
ncbi:5098_t:CDS:1, partial [Gigaspora rosea]